MPHTYIGAEERTYPAYLEIPADAPPRTLTGRPGGESLEIRRGSGNETLPDVPDDGLWVSATLPKKDAAPDVAQDDPADDTTKTGPKTRKAAS